MLQGWPWHRPACRSPACRSSSRPDDRKIQLVATRYGHADVFASYWCSRTTMWRAPLPRQMNPGHCQCQYRRGQPRKSMTCREIRPIFTPLAAQLRTPLKSSKVTFWALQNQNNLYLCDIILLKQHCWESKAVIYPLDGYLPLSYRGAVLEQKRDKASNSLTNAVQK